MDIQDELMDRFGDIPRSTASLLMVVALGALAHKVYIAGVMVNRREVRLLVYQKARVQVDKIPELIQSFKGDLKLIPGEVPSFHYVGRRDKNRDSLTMVEKTKEMLRGLCGLRL